MATVSVQKELNRQNFLIEGDMTSDGEITVYHKFFKGE